jgi:hypothetical protein
MCLVEQMDVLPILVVLELFFWIAMLDSLIVPVLLDSLEIHLYPVLQLHKMKRS